MGFTYPYKSYAGSWKAGLTVANLDGEGIKEISTLDIDPDSLTFTMDYQGFNPPSRNIKVKNATSPRTLSWVAEIRQPWVRVTPSIGNANQNGQNVTVSIDGSQLPWGTSSTRVIFKSTTPDVEEPTQPLQVTVIVAPPPSSLTVTPDAIDAQGFPGRAIPSHSLSISQTIIGFDEMDWVAGVIPAVQAQALRKQVAATPLAELIVQPEAVAAELNGQIVTHAAVDWVSLAPDGGTTPTTVAVDFRPSGLAPGRHDATIVFDSGRGAADRFRWIPVTLTLGEGKMVYLPLVE
jgi:hypothetical protein